MFRIDAKTSEKSIKAKKVLLPFRFISLRTENEGAPNSSLVIAFTETMYLTIIDNFR